jgi:hypothetical protein
MTSPDLDLQRERAARNQSLFRDINERIEELQFDHGQRTSGYVCECLDTTCTELIQVEHDEYKRIRRNPTEFVVVPGHEYPAVEEVVDKTARWYVVRKIGAGGEVANQLAKESLDITTRPSHPAHRGRAAASHRSEVPRQRAADAAGRREQEGAREVGAATSGYLAIEQVLALV